MGGHDPLIGRGVELLGDGQSLSHPGSRDKPSRATVTARWLPNALRFASAVASRFNEYRLSYAFRSRSLSHWMGNGGLEKRRFEDVGWRTSQKAFFPQFIQMRSVTTIPTMHSRQSLAK
jgi:hypothetical protein